MSLFNLIHKDVIIKFADSANDHFDPAVSHVFRLTGVDAMGFLQVQHVKPNHEAVSEPYWINKDLIREIHELHPATAKGTLRYTGTTSKAAKAKTAAKPKPVLN